MNQKKLITLLLYIFFVECYILIPNPDAGNFVDQVVANGIDGPTNIAFAPDGRIFVTEKQGRVRIISADGQLQTAPWLDIIDLVANAQDKGLVGLTFDPNFAQNGYVYVIFTVDPIEGQPDEAPLSVAHGAIVRYTEKDGVADKGTALYLVGRTRADGFPICNSAHTVGDIIFGRDGTLLASAGDGAHYEFPDFGQDITEYDPVCQQWFGDIQDVGSQRANSLDSIAGKIVRIDPTTGNGIGPDNGKNLVPNPWYDAANPAAPRSRIWAKGMRNPYRLTLRLDVPVDNGPGVIYAADVGMKTFEEINVIKTGGQDQGWPCLNGPNLQEPFFANTPEYLAFCERVVPLMPHTLPAIIWHRNQNNYMDTNVGFTGNAAAGAAIYTGTTYPTQYRQGPNKRAVFFADYGQQWIKVAWFDQNDNLLPELGIQDFAGPGIGALVCIRVHPVTGELHWVDLAGSIKKFVYVGPDVPPPENPIVLYADATPKTFLATADKPVTVQFNTDGTYYPVAGNPLYFQWDFGDGSPVSNLPNPKHTYNEAKVFTVTVKVSDIKDNFENAQQTQITLTGNQSPLIVKIVKPVDNYIFSRTETIMLDGEITRENGENLNEAEVVYHWEVRLIHNNHFHKDTYVSDEKSPQVAIGPLLDDETERNSLEIYLTGFYTVPGTNIRITSQDMIRALPQGMPNALPEPKFTVTPNNGNVNVPLTVNVNGVTSTDADMDLMKYTWNWGDGTVGSGTETYHTYYPTNENPFYDITLYVEDVEGKKVALTQRVTINVDGIPVTASPTIQHKVQTIEIRGEADTKIFYTLDGTDPTTVSNEYTEPISVTKNSEGVTIKAIAYRNGQVPSLPVTAKYNYKSLSKDDLIGVWSFDDIESSDVTIDCSGNNNDGSVRGATSSSNGVFGSAASFTPADSVTIRASDSLSNLFNGLSLSFFIKSEVTSGTQTFISKKTTGSNLGYSVTYDADSKTLRFLAGAATKICSAENVDLTTNQWRHVAITANGAVCAIYVDGTARTSTADIDPVTDDGAADLVIGGFTGSLDSLFLYGRPLTAGEIAAWAPAVAEFSETCKHQEPSTTGSVSVPSTTGTESTGTQATGQSTGSNGSTGATGTLPTTGSTNSPARDEAESDGNVVSISTSMIVFTVVSLFVM